MDRKPHVIVLGSGVSGLSVAWSLASNSVSVDVLEADSQVGGLAKTVREGDYYLDVGPHSFFSDDDDILRKLLAFFEDEPLEPIPRAVKFLYKGAFLDYPLTPKSVFLQMGLLSGLMTGLSFLKGKLIPYRSPTLGTEEETVEDWAVSSFGRHLYHTFFKPYTEQFWKVPCNALSARTIPNHTRTSFGNVLRTILLQKISKGDASLVERESLPTYYPKTGFGEFPERVAGAVLSSGGRIHLGCRVTEVSEIGNDGMVVKFEKQGTQEQIEGTHVVSTLPLNSFIPMLRPVPQPEVLASAEKLEYRGLLFLGMITEKQQILDCGYIYVLNRPYNRVTEMNEFSPSTSPEGENILGVEIPMYLESPVWDANKEEIFDMCIGSLAQEGFLQPGDVKGLILLKAPYAYPIYKKDYAGHLKQVFDYIEAKDRLFSFGRSGGFMYMDIDVCARQGLELGKTLLSKFEKVPEG